MCTPTLEHQYKAKIVGPQIVHIVIEILW